MWQLVIPRGERAARGDEAQAAVLDDETPAIELDEAVPISMRDAGGVEAEASEEHHTSRAGVGGRRSSIPKP